MNTEAFNLLLEICCGLGIIVGGIKAVAYLLTPYKKAVDEIDKHERLLSEHKENLEEIINQQLYERECINAIGMAIAELIGHAVSGNDIEELKQRERELNQVLLQYRP